MHSRHSRKNRASKQLKDRRPSFIGNIEHLEDRNMLDASGLSIVPADWLFRDQALTSPGIYGRYINGSLRSVNDDNWSDRGGSIRVDSSLNFTTDSWGTRSQVGITGGTDADWNNYSVQWDGYVSIPIDNVRLYTASDDGSRMWIDVNGDGDFLDPGELVNNSWGGAQPVTTGPATTPLTLGTHKIRIQFEEGTGGNRFQLLVGNRETVDGLTVVPSSMLTPSLNAFGLPDIAMPLFLPGTNRGLVGIYYDQNLRTVTEPILVPNTPIAGVRIDSELAFYSDAWGTNRHDFASGFSVPGLSHGSDANWDEFTAVWVGRITIPETGIRLSVRSGDGSRMWITPLGNYDFEHSHIEFIDNGWSEGQVLTTSQSTAPLAKGTYEILINYQEINVENRFFLLAEAPTPTGLRAQATGTNSIRVSWDRSLSVGDYFLERSTTSAGPYQQIAILSATQTSYTDSGNHLQADTTYFYRLRSVVGGISSRDTGSVSTKTLPTFDPGPAIFPFTQLVLSFLPEGTIDPQRQFPVLFIESIDPSSFSAADVTIRQGNRNVAVVSIDPLADLFGVGANSLYVVNFTQQSIPGTYTVTIGPNVTDVAGNKMNQDGDQINGESTADRFVGTFDIAAPPIPAAPSGLMTTVESANVIFIDWDDVPGADNYRLYRSTSSDGPWTQQIYFAADSEYRDAGNHLSPGTTYYYRVLASNPSGDSSLSTIATATTPAPLVPGPRILTLPDLGTLSAPLSYVSLEFDMPIQPATFTTSDVEVLHDGSPVPLLRVEQNPTGSNIFRLVFSTPITNPGRYNIRIRPDILGLNGQPLNQNDNDINGESPTSTSDGDSFSATFQLAGAPDDHGDDAEHATPIAVNHAFNGTLENDADRDVFSFAAVAGHRYYVKSTIGSMPAESALRLYRESGSLGFVLVPTGVDPIIEIVAPLSGRLFIEFEASNSAPLHYDLQLFDVTPGTVSGRVFKDYNSSGSFDAGEPGFANLDLRLTGTDIAGRSVDHTIRTTAVGTYLIFDVPPSRDPYSLTLTPPGIIRQTSPATEQSAVTFSLDSQQNATQDFGFTAPLTIIVHGFQPPPLDNNVPSEWTYDMANAIEDRTGLSPEDVYVFDWAHESSIESQGWAEAAGHRLYAEILALLIDNTVPRDLHFIAHSRGAVVSSQAIEALSFFKGSLVNKIQLTTLDPHPANDDPAYETFFTGYGSEFNVQDSQPTIWNIIDWSDNYYQMSDAPSWEYDPQGQPLNGAVNIDLTTRLRSWSVTRFFHGNLFYPYDSDHESVHDWYNWSIDINSAFALPEYADEYLSREEMEFAVNPFVRSALFTHLLVDGESVNGDNGQAVGYAWAENSSPTDRPQRQLSDALPSPSAAPLMFNGGFSLGGSTVDLTHASDNGMLHVFPGFVTNDDEYLNMTRHEGEFVLTPVIGGGEMPSTTGDYHFLRTDTLFLPKDATSVLFNWMIPAGVAIPRNCVIDIGFVSDRDSSYHLLGSLVASDLRARNGVFSAILGDLLANVRYGLVGSIEMRLRIPASTLVDSDFGVHISDLKVSHNGSLIPVAVATSPFPSYAARDAAISDADANSTMESMFAVNALDLIVASASSVETVQAAPARRNLTTQSRSKETHLSVDILDDSGLPGRDSAQLVDIAQANEDSNVGEECDKVLSTLHSDALANNSTIDSWEL